MLNQCELAGITTYTGIFLVDVWTLHTNLARGVGFWSVVETVDYADVERAVFFRQLDMIIFVATVTTATLTIAVIEAGLGDRERQQVALPIALGFDMKDREVCRWVDTTSDARCIKVVRFGEFGLCAVELRLAAGAVDDRESCAS